jgi:hypothetical protein
MATSDDDLRYGVGLAMPFGWGASDLRQAAGTRLLEMDLALTVGVNRGELPYALREGGRLRQLKHTKIPSAGRAALAVHLMGEALRQDPRIRVGATTVTSDGGTVTVSTGYEERRYSGSGGSGIVDYEVPA